MPINVSADVKIDEYLRDSTKLFRQFGETPQNPLYQETQQFIKPLAGEIRSATPVDEGVLRKTVKAEVRFSKRTGAIIAQVGYFFKGRFRNEVGRIIAARTFERDKGTIRNLARRYADSFRQRLTKAAQRAANRTIGN